MIIKSIWRPLLAVALLLLINSNLQAHQVKAALTRIELNPRTNMLEIMHRFELHDAEHAVKEIFGGSADIIKDATTQKQFADYVAQRFGIYYPNDEPLDISLVGYEVEGKHFWVYQETPKPEKLEGLQVVHNALRDIWFAQTNLVNVKLDQSINSLTFTDNTEVLKIDFAHH
ncbi:DUF6702 family protein [Glaciecola sp. 1036]|uniref:DUF6702 family protein n=1 Tax=Alteromonadaceae TaxID=72275 RepID=UPI003CFF09B5